MTPHPAPTLPPSAVRCPSCCGTGRVLTRIPHPDEPVTARATRRGLRPVRRVSDTWSKPVEGSCVLCSGLGYVRRGEHSERWSVATEERSRRLLGLRAGWSKLCDRCYRAGLVAEPRPGKDRPHLCSRCDRLIDTYTPGEVLRRDMYAATLPTSPRAAGR